MSTAKAKTINLLLEDGTLNGVISIEDSSWNAGELYSAPRESVDDLISSEACKKFGVYLLISDEKVYVGQSSDLSKRIKQHKIGKDWWERVIILTTISDTLNRSDIDYLESVLIAKAEESNRLDCDNKNKGNKQKVTKFRKVELDQWLDEAMLLMELIGVTVFSSKKVKTKPKVLINTVEMPPEGTIEIRAKQYAKAFLAEQGIVIDKQFSYAKRLDNKEKFWINPQTSFVDVDWTIVLNNQVESKLILIEVPAKTFSISTGNKEEGLKTRRDKPYQIDLEINSETLIDERSKYDFSPYVKQIFNY